jgi:predicted ATPase/DNA-binding SARP family transcriptional activator/DNA-binding CsgD family transcriptional regulator
MSARRTPHATHPSQDSLDREPEAARVRLLGGFSVWVGPRILRQKEWRSKKASTLVKLLALAPGHRMHREQVMDFLWPDLGTKAASNNLRQVVYGARRVLASASDLPGRYLGSREEHLVLCPEGQLWVDVDAFEEASSTARRSRDPSAYGAAIDLYAGDLLPEDRYERWAEGRRNELRQLYLGLLIELAGLHEGRGEHALAIETLRKATSEEPTLEEAHASIMRLYALSGRHERALAQYERLRDALQSGFDTRPTEATRRLRNEIASGELLPKPPAGPVLPAPSDGAKHNLPAPMSSFVGREREMVDLRRSLSMTRLLTLTGAGGSGKTRLALEMGRDLVGMYPDGVWLVELAPLLDDGLVTQEVANVLGVQERPGEPLAGTLAKALAGKEVLLVLDNCEHVVEAAARLVYKLLASCPRLKVLATSRESLAVLGEVNWAVPPLSLPDGTTDGKLTAGSLVRYEAVRLFVDRCRLRIPDFELTWENAQAVARVCRRLDGIPLAIELATARMGTLAVEQVAQRLDASLDVLRGNIRGAAPRQQTLRAALDWSYNLLSEGERTFFRRLSAFAGGWTLAAAEEVCSGDGIGREDILDLLGGLVDKSLVVAGASTDGAVRYKMLQPIRQYAREKLKESGEIEEVQSRHVTYFLALAEEAQPELAGPQQRLWVERLEGEHDNLREAISWVLQRGEDPLALRFGGALWRFWFQGGYLSEGVRWLEQVLAGAEPEEAAARVRALEGMGWLTQVQGDTERAKATYAEMMELSRNLDDKGNLATALNSLGMLAVTQGDTDRATSLLEQNLAVLREMEGEENAATVLKRYHAINLLGILAISEEADYTRGAALFKQSLALAREAEDAYRVTASLIALQYVAVLQGNYERATALYEEALAAARELGNASVEIIPEALVNLGLAALGQADYQRAVMSFKEALVISQNTERKSTIINALEGMASVAGALGEATRAAHLWGAAEASREVTGIALPPGDRALHEPHLSAARSRLEEAVWEELLSEGRAMALKAAAEYALSSEMTDLLTTPGPEEPSAVGPLSSLSRREREVATLVARGLSNRQVARELSISERTAANHVAKILRKLGLRSRVQIASWVAQRQPLASEKE